MIAPRPAAIAPIAIVFFLPNLSPDHMQNKAPKYLSASRAEQHTTCIIDPINFRMTNLELSHDVRRPAGQSSDEGEQQDPGDHA